MSAASGYVLERERLDDLFAALTRRGYTLIGPTVQDGAIVYAELSSSAELPVGYSDEQEGGHYRLRRREDRALFAYNVGPHSLKRYQLPAQTLLWRARVREDGSLGELAEAPPESVRYAFIGARSCELRARDCWSTCCSAARTPTPPTRRGCRTRSSSQRSARRRARPASAPRWGVVRPRATDSTSR